MYLLSRQSLHTKRFSLLSLGELARFNRAIGIFAVGSGVSRETQRISFPKALSGQHNPTNDLIPFFYH